MTKKIIIKIYIFIIIYIHGYFKLNNIFKDLDIKKWPYEIVIDNLSTDEEKKYIRGRNYSLNI